MARWVRRIPKTARARIQLVNWMSRLGSVTYSHATVMRLARIVELRKPDDISVSAFLRSLHPSYDGLGNAVIRELDHRKSERIRDPAPRPTVTLDDWIAS